MISQNGAQSLLKEMGGAVVLACGETVGLAHLQSHFIAGLKHTLCHFPYMADLAALEMDGILHLETAVLAEDHSRLQ